MSDALFWEQHVCLPHSTSAEVGELLRYARPGGAYICVNVGYAPTTAAQTRALLNHFRAGIERDDHLMLAATVDDVDAAHADDRIAVAFDLEDAGPLEGDLDLVAEFYAAGVRSLLPTYNLRNAAGSGCLDTHDDGLTRYGRDLVARMNEVGMLVDGSHCGIRTALDLCAASTDPVIYSHSGLRAVWDHPRNITDEQAVAVAETGGVIGIPGVGIFLGPNTATVDAMVAHIDHAVSLVGIDHVGIGSDFAFDADDINAEIARNPHLFPESMTRWGLVQLIEPETLLLLESALADRGYAPEHVAAIAGGNFRRVATQVWQPPAG
ncbi:dipeptidase [Actinophytocola sp.]|uniref:dipeptidase n=1 Tax=Actinophytocola sp. TaxID=1872138 RepID=UPI002ED1CA46